MGGEIPSTACKPVQHEGTSGSRYKEVSGGVLGALLVVHGMWNLPCRSVRVVGVVTLVEYLPQLGDCGNHHA